MVNFLLTGGNILLNGARMLHSLETTISAQRLSTYLLAANHSETRALDLYRWNTRLGESFHLPLQAVEIAFRNRINVVLITVFGADWWCDPAFMALASLYQQKEIQASKDRISKTGRIVSTGQIVAGLSFGFWVSMLGGHLNPRIWSRHLRAAFPHLPSGYRRATVQRHMREIADFRNRIWHHEPIFNKNLTQQFSDCMAALGWLCADKLAWVKPQCQVMQVHRDRPV
jgi:hypothetical protein